MKIAILSPIAWRTPPENYGPWENVTSMLTETLVSKGIDVTLFATGNSITKAKLQSVCKKGYEEDNSINPKVWECLHISNLFDQANNFDLIHNNFDFLPLTFLNQTATPILTTIHGFSSPAILPVYKKYNSSGYYVAISDADRSDELNYIDTIYHGININDFTFFKDKKDYLLFFGRIHHDKGAKEAIEIAKKAGKKLILSGIIQDIDYHNKEILPHIDGKNVIYAGVSGPKMRDKLLGEALALIHPINFHEPFGLSVIEAMACGTPVIAFNKGSMPELIVQNKNGFLVNTIDEAVDAVKLLKNIENTYCRKYIEENFTKEIMTDKYIKVYKEILQKEKREDKRPWGWYKILEDEPEHKVKRILVYPKKRLSLQRHNRRSEHWYIIEGEGVITINEEKIKVTSGKSVNIKKKSLHRIENTGNTPLVFVEIQTGDYFGEDDIERVEDDFGRT